MAGKKQTNIISQTTNIISQYLWVKNLEVDYLGTSGLESVMRLKSNCWVGLHTISLDRLYLTVS